MMSRDEGVITNEVDKKMRVIVCTGLPASGKSTFARTLMEKDATYKRINRDDLRLMLDNGAWSRAKEKHIRQAELTLAEYFVAHGFNLVIDDCNLSPTARDMWLEFTKRVNATHELKDFTQVDVETCVERDRKRPNYVGEQVIRRMYRDFLQPKPPVLVHDPALSSAIVCDLDGTLALLNGRNPYDAARCEEDVVNEPIADILKTYLLNGYIILLASGRSEQHRPQTERWLQKHNIQYNTLYMRVTGDIRKDAIVKREIYEHHMQGRYTIKFVLDDRNQVVELWRSLGLTVLQVADGDF